MSPTAEENAAQAARWLLARETHPRDAREAWAHGLAAAVRVGVHFEVVHLPAALVRGCVGGIKDDHAVRERFRAAGIEAGVMVSRTRERYGVLVAPGTHRNWDVPGTACLGRGGRSEYVAVPPPHRAEPPGAYWLLPAPDGPGTTAGARPCAGCGRRGRILTPDTAPVTGTDEEHRQ